MAKINRINPEGISKPFSNYSHVVTAEGAQKLVFCAGQVAADVDGKVLPPDDFDAQAKMVMANLTKALAAGGAKLSDVTKITIYLCNPHDVPKARGLLQTYSKATRPAARSASCAGSPIRTFCWRSRRSPRCDFPPARGPSKGGPPSLSGPSHFTLSPHNLLLLVESYRQKISTGILLGSSGMYLLAVFRAITTVLMNRRYRPELHYMRGPGPKWF